MITIWAVPPWFINSGFLIQVCNDRFQKRLPPSPILSAAAAPFAAPPPWRPPLPPCAARRSCAAAPGARGGDLGAGPLQAVRQELDGLVDFRENPIYKLDENG